MVRLTYLRLAGVICVAFLAAAARAEDLYAVTDTATLIHFDSAAPGTVTTVGPVTGITTGTLQSIDFRPATGQLYALSYDLNTDAAQLYTINRATAAATPLGGPVTLTGTGGAARVSIDFNPVTDVLRLVTGGTTSTSYRINPTTGAVLAQDTNLAYAAGDPHAGTTPYVASLAYSDNTPAASATTLYGYDFGIDAVVRVGSVGGSPTSPNAGQLFTVGNSGQATLSNTIGFDVSGASGTAYLAANVQGFDEHLLSVDLTTGAATDLGVIGGGLETLDIAVAVAAVPEPAGLAFLAAALAAGALGGRVWRRWRPR